MKLKIIGMVVLSLVMASSVALADNLLFTTGGWQNLAPSDINQNNTGNPFWANVSMDGANLNVGYILTGSTPPYSTNYLGYNTTGPNYGGAQYLATSSGGAVDNVDVGNLGPGSTATTLIITIAGNSGTNTFGIYNPGAATNNSSGNFFTSGTGTYHQIFAGGASPGTVSVTIPTGWASYGFYFYDAHNGYMFVSDPVSSQLYSADSSSNFAFFRNSGDLSTFWIGMEDLTQADINGREGCFGDFNDMIVSVNIPGAVPLPPSALLLGTGLLGLVGFGWRRRNQA